MKGFDYSEIKESKFYERFRPLGKFIGNRLFELEFAGLENVPKEGGFIIASNHIHAIDPGAVSLMIEDRQTHFMAKKELFENPVTGFIFKRLNGFPVVRGGADSEALNYAVRVVKEGHILGIFPEGTRSPDQKPQKAKNGVARIARAAHADVLPVAIINDEGLARHSKYTVRYGELIHYEELGLTDDGGREELKNASELIMNKIVELWEEGHCE